MSDKYKVLVRVDKELEGVWRGLVEKYGSLSKVVEGLLRKEGE